MAYCTVDDLNDYAVHLDISATSDPTSIEVGSMITSVDTVIDQKLNAVGVTVPVTDSDLLEVVKPISIHGTLARLYRAIEMNSEQAAIYQDLHDKAIAEIMKTPAIMQTSATNIATPTGFTSRGTPTFERGGDNW